MTRAKKKLAAFSGSKKSKQSLLHLVSLDFANFKAVSHTGWFPKCNRKHWLMRRTLRNPSLRNLHEWQPVLCAREYADAGYKSLRDDANRAEISICVRQRELKLLKRIRETLDDHDEGYRLEDSLDLQLTHDVCCYFYSITRSSYVKQTRDSSNI